MATALTTLPTRAASVGKPRVSFQSDPIDDGFAFVRVNGKVHLAQLTSSHFTVCVKLYRHEFLSIFRLSDCFTIDPAEGGLLRVLEQIDSSCLRYEQDNETVYLAKDLAQKFARLADPMSAGRPGAPLRPRRAF